MFIEFWGYV